MREIGGGGGGGGALYCKYNEGIDGKYKCSPNCSIHWKAQCKGLRAGLDVSEKRKNVLALPGFEPPTVQPVVWSLHQMDYSDSRLLSCSDVMFGNFYKALVVGMLAIPID